MLGAILDTIAQIISDKMSDKSVEQKIITAICQNNQVSAKLLALQLELSQRTIERYLKSIQAAGKIKRIGARRGGFWQVIQ